MAKESYLPIGLGKLRSRNASKIFAEIITGEFTLETLEQKINAIKEDINQGRSVVMELDHKKLENEED